eukprot:759971-Hanusia_phi.AAC.1
MVKELRGNSAHRLKARCHYDPANNTKPPVELLVPGEEQEEGRREQSMRGGVRRRRGLRIRSMRVKMETTGRRRRRRRELIKNQAS